MKVLFAILIIHPGFGGYTGEIWKDHPPLRTSVQCAKMAAAKTKILPGFDRAVCVVYGSNERAPT